MKTMTKNEKMVLEAMIENAKNVGDTGVEFWLEDVAKICNMSFASVKGTAGSLRNKGLIFCYNGECCFDGEVRPEGFAKVSEQENNELLSDKETKYKSETSIADSSSIKSVNTIPETKKSEINRKIGDRHPKHPDWVWVEYMPGCFDWRHEKNSAKYGVNPQPVIRSVEEILKSTPSEPLTDGEKGLFMLLESGFKFIEKKTKSPLQGYLYLPISKKTMLVSLVTISNLFHKFGVTKEEMKQFHV